MQEEGKEQEHMKKLLIVLFGMMSMCSLWSCAEKKDRVEDKTADISNPWVKVESVAAAKNKTGENFRVPTQLPEGYMEKEVSVMDDWLIEIVYEKDGDQLIYRVGAMVAGQKDISGIQEEYEDTQALQVEDMDVIVSGDGHSVALTTWEAKDYAYSLYATPGLNQEEIEKIVTGVQNI
jgi:hypothetical protein